MDDPLNFDILTESFVSLLAERLSIL